MKQTYKFDAHMHTAETSKCGRIPARELVERYHANGYAGIAITDHMHDEYISLLYCHEDWDTCVDRFLDGYRRAKQRGDELGLAVVLGMELRFEENENDYLVYGIDEAFLRNNPYPYRMGPQEFFRRFGGQLLIIQAHPFRKGNTFIRRDCVHGIELVNAHRGHANFNENALAFAKEHEALYRLAGSDTHRPGEECWAWTLFDTPVTDSFAYKAAVEQGHFTLGAKDPLDQAVITKAQAYFGK